MDPEAFLEDLLRLYGEGELDILRGLIGSSTLRAAARLMVDGAAGTATLLVPHYWAVFYHDGRGGFEAPSGRFLVFFEDPADDPRLEGGRPERLSQVRRLTREEFHAGLEENQTRAELGGPPFMRVVRAVGPAPAHPFFDQLAVGAAERMTQIAGFAADAYAQDVVDDEGPQKSTARVRL